MLDILPEDEQFSEFVKSNQLNFISEETLFELKLIDLGLCKQTQFDISSQ